MPDESYYKKKEIWSRFLHHNNDGYSSSQSKILNDDDLLSQFIRHQNLAKKSGDHTCHCASSMVDGTRKKKLRDGTTKIYPTMPCTKKLCRNQLSVRKNTLFSFTDWLDRPNSNLHIRTIMEIICLWCLEIPSKTIAKLGNVSQATMVDSCEKYVFKSFYNLIYF